MKRAEISGKKKIKEYYEDKEIVGDYVVSRFTTAIGMMEHQTQVDFVSKAIKKYRCKKALELAPGPARITSYIKIKEGIAMDYSDGMVKFAKERLPKSLKNNWNIIQGDAFNIKYKNKFDIVFTFRFIFHFKKAERDKLYQQIKKALKKEGIFIFEAINIDVAKRIREFVGKDKYVVYDKLYTKNELIKELKSNGFKVVLIESNTKHFYAEIFISKLTGLLKLNKLGLSIIRLIEKIPSGDPYGWTILCQK
jgi:SAM-dependent methyltransferase